MRERRLHLHLCWTPPSLWQKSPQTALLYPGHQLIQPSLASGWSMSSVRRGPSLKFWVRAFDHPWNLRNASIFPADQFSFYYTEFWLLTVFQMFLAHPPLSPSVISCLDADTTSASSRSQVGGSRTSSSLPHRPQVGEALFSTVVMLHS